MLNDLILAGWSKGSTQIFASSPTVDLTLDEFLKKVEIAAAFLDHHSVKNSVAFRISDQLLLLILTWASLKTNRNIILIPPFEDEASSSSAVVDGTMISDKDVGRSLLVTYDLLNSHAATNKNTLKAQGFKGELTVSFLTSGTTGDQKLVKNSLSNIENALKEIRNSNILANVQGNVVFISLPLIHSYGFSATLEHLMLGNSVILSGNSEFGQVFSALAAQRVANRVTLLEGVPYFYKCLGLIINKISLNRLKHLAIGGDAVQTSDLHHFINTFNSLSCSIRYGISEIPSFVAYKFFDQINASFYNSFLDILSPYKIKFDYPLLANRRSQVFSIINLDGFECKTGDLGILNQEGQLRIIGRIGRYIKIKGLKIDLLPIENFLIELFAIATCRAQAGRDNLVIEVTTDNESFNPEVAINRLRKNFYLPFGINIVRVSDIPRTASGKIIRHQPRK